MVDKELIINKKKFAILESLITCSICCKLIDTPVQCCQCENSFCKECLDDWRKKANICPFKCNKSTFQSSKIVSVLLSQILLSCPNSCGLEIPSNEYQRHITNECPKIIKKMNTKGY